jgi:cytochrome c oxidase subunit 2
LFEQLRCNTCHQGGGLASRGPALEDLFGSTVRLQGGQTVVADENYIRESILRPQAKLVAGYPPIMPSFEGQIGEEGLNQLVREIKALGGAGRRPEGRDDATDRGPEQRPPTTSQEPPP